MWPRTWPSLFDLPPIGVIWCCFLAGLGPTSDDLTVDMVAELVGVQAVMHEPSAQNMRKRFAAAGIELVANSDRQVRAPEGAKVYTNSTGLAPGFEVRCNGASVIALPGPPRELKAIFADHLHERISELRLARGETLEHVGRRIFRVFGKGESHIARPRLMGWLWGRAQACTTK